MLKLLIGRDWLKNREEIFLQIARDVHNRQGNRILLVPELISHESERLLCDAAGDTSSRFAEVLSFTRLIRRVSDYSGRAVTPVWTTAAELWPWLRFPDNSAAG